MRGWSCIFSSPHARSVVGRTQTWSFSDADEAEDIAGRRAACGPPHSAFIRVVKREIYGISRNSSETQLAFSSGNYSINVAKVETMEGWDLNCWTELEDFTNIGLAG